MIISPNFLNGIWISRTGTFFSRFTFELDFFLSHSQFFKLFFAAENSIFKFIDDIPPLLPDSFALAALPLLPIRPILGNFYLTNSICIGFNLITRINHLVMPFICYIYNTLVDPDSNRPVVSNGSLELGTTDTADNNRRVNFVADALAEFTGNFVPNATEKYKN